MMYLIKTVTSIQGVPNQYISIHNQNNDSIYDVHSANRELFTNQLTNVWVDSQMNIAQKPQLVDSHQNAVGRQQFEMLHP